MKKPNLNNFGKKLKFKERVKKQETYTEKDLFIESMELLEQTWIRSNESYEKFKINLLEYEEQFYQIIEGFILLKYGIWKAEIILWYIFSRVDEENNIFPLTYIIKDNEEEDVILNNPTDLWEFLNKIDNANKETE
tara:strand:- start:3011 stop:3418 length:408 start_codon:yes stop_codon:yes gene_type:complete